ncbi:glucanase B [Apiospora saccharicola]|uniref:Glucanase B n=1 Tax=Apiospora saccharicola TaxID=335842 RepID=A0ABR1VPS6_9PEZI
MFLTSAGTWYQPAITGANLVKIDPIVVPGFNPNQASITELLIPAEIESGRVWISRGELQFRVMVSEGGIPFITEPSALDLTDDTSWGFLELTSSKRNGLYANLSFVDFVGLALSMVLVLNSDQIQTVIGTPHNALTSICDALNVQTRVDGIPWGKLCILADDGRPLRVLSPNLYEAANPGATEGYYHQYVTQVWKKYSSHDLYIDTQSWAGLVRCMVDANEEMVCDGDNRAYARPNTADIWGCNTGPFSIREHDNYIHRLIVPRLCAAFSRTTLLMDKGESNQRLAIPAIISIALQIITVALFIRMKLTEKDMHFRMMMSTLLQRT